MSALRWEQPDEHLGEEAARDAERTPTPLAGVRLDAVAGDDAPARGIVLGTAISVLGFWAPLAALLTWRRVASRRG